MVNNCEDLVRNFCVLIFQDRLDRSPSTDICTFIAQNNKNISLFRFADRNCDLDSLIQRELSFFISKRSIVADADSFKDNNLDDDWDEIYFDKIYSELLKHDQTLPKTEIVWIKRIINYRFWTIKNIDFITNYSVRMSNETINKFSDQLQEVRAQVGQVASQIDQAENSIANVLSEAKKAQEQAKSAHKKARHVIDSTNNLIPNMLTSLGIFVTIIVTIVAVYISNVLTPSDVEFNIPQMRYGRYVLSGQITLNAIFLLLYFIAKLTGKTLHISRNIEAIEKKTTNMNFLQASLFYNPLMWTINIGLCFAYIFLYDWWLFESYLWPQMSVVLSLSEGTVNGRLILYGIVCIVFSIMIPLAILLIFCNSAKKKIPV